MGHALPKLYCRKGHRLADHLHLNGYGAGCPACYRVRKYGKSYPIFPHMCVWGHDKRKGHSSPSMRRRGRCPTCHRKPIEERQAKRQAERDKRKRLKETEQARRRAQREEARRQAEIGLPRIKQTGQKGKLYCKMGHRLADYSGPPVTPTHRHYCHACHRELYFGETYPKHPERCPWGHIRSVGPDLPRSVQRVSPMQCRTCYMQVARRCRKKYQPKVKLKRLLRHAEASGVADLSAVEKHVEAQGYDATSYLQRIRRNNQTEEGKCRRARRQLRLARSLLRNRTAPVLRTLVYEMETTSHP